MKLPWLSILAFVLSLIAGFLFNQLEWIIPQQWRVPTFIITFVVIVIAVIGLSWHYTRLILEQSYSKKREQISRRAQHLAKVMIEAMAEIMTPSVEATSLKWLKTDEAKAEERGAKHEIWICTADLEPDTTAFLSDPILQNLRDKKRYRYILDETEIRRFKTLQDNARRVPDVIEDKRLEGKCSPYELSNIQLVILDAGYASGAYRKVYLHFPFLTHSGEENTVQIEKRSRVDELVHLFETFWESLPEVPWE